MNCMSFNNLLRKHTKHFSYILFCSFVKFFLLTNSRVTKPSLHISLAPISYQRKITKNNFQGFGEQEVWQIQDIIMSFSSAIQTSTLDSSWQATFTTAGNAARSGAVIRPLHFSGQRLLQEHLLVWPLMSMATGLLAAAWSVLGWDKWNCQADSLS